MAVSRTLAAALIVLLLVAPLAEAQPATRRWRIGYLGATSATAAVQWVASLRRGLQDHGYLEGQNFVIEYRWAEGRYDRLDGLAADLVRQRVDVIVAPTTTSAQAAKRATTTIPIVFLLIADPVAQGFVTSFARPGGNATGLAATGGPEIYGKLLELLAEAVPGTTRVAVLSNPASPFGALALREVERAARSHRVQLTAHEALRPEAFENVFRAAVRARADGLLVLPDPMFFAQRTRLAELEARHRVPTIYGFRQHAEAGGLMAYGVDIADLYRRAGGYVARILGGARPRDLPVEQPRTFEFTINVKTARTLGLTLSPTLLLRANQVIE